MTKDNILLMVQQRMYATPTQPIHPSIEYSLQKHIENIELNHPGDNNLEQFFMSIDALLKHYSL